MRNETNYNLCDFQTVEKLLKKHSFAFSKTLGQNFLIDDYVCPEMAALLNSDEKTAVIEVGPGIGVLTKELCKTSGKVISVELDKRLYPILEETLGEFDNFELIEGDALKLDFNKLINEHLAGYNTIKFCANLPYYITSELIMKLLEEKASISEIVVMVQKEAAQRLCAQLGTRKTGAVTVAVKYYGEAEILFEVGRESFMPSPKVDSAVIKITVNDDKKYPVGDEKKFFSLVRAAFAQRRKTLVNSVSSSLGIQKSDVANALNELSLNPNIRAEELTMEDFVGLFDLLF
ncbi:MAG: 16S rRNA (adenine(1518)-N(6)/adenine(1519)-N(6))-dimethyltransferase RsmA [Eubacterium sp.]|nr:16S rRNA (adenine(1518)-N(6)/adenine(1519)-N(6))-dimethyltransferase RsmA [Eubacterium sp.]